LTLRRAAPAWRVLLSAHVTSGLSAALGLLAITTMVHLALGAGAAAAASVGVIVATPADQPAPQRGKFWHLLPAVLLCPPLFLAVQWLHADPWALTLLLVPASFAAFLGGAWGKRGLPLTVSVMFAMVFSLAAPARPGGETALALSAHFALGALTYAVWATAANALLNGRYRAQLLADAVRATAALARAQAAQFQPAADASAAGGAPPLIGLVLRQQAALTDQLQASRDLVLESPRTPRRLVLAGMLLQLLEMRDHLVACELDLDALRTWPPQRALLAQLQQALHAQADGLDAVADALLRGRRPPPWSAPRPTPPEAADPAAAGPEADAARLAQGLVDRVGHLHDELQRLTALARGDRAPDAEIVRSNWQLFTSPTRWSWQPLAAVWRRDAPALRHAVRAALAIAAGQLLALALPWGTHDYWILLTIVVVLRGSLAQTLERRNSRVAGTLLGCALAGALLAAHLGPLALVACVTLAQGVAHAFAVRRYLVTAVAATVLALLQAHQLDPTARASFDALERLADTLIGAALAWGFSYVLPSWERGQIPALVARTLAAQARHAHQALNLGQLDTVDDRTELAWRLARREAYDSLSVLVQATLRALVEPRAVRPPLPALGRLLAHSYQLLAQLTAVKSLLLLRRDRLAPAQIRPPLQQAANAIAAALTLPLPPRAGPAAAAAAAAPEPVALPDLHTADLSPWLLRRLALARGLALQLADDAREAAPVAAA
jgi:uncharacterized membrane protein YccC